MTEHNPITTVVERECLPCEGTGINIAKLDEDLVIECPHCEGYGKIYKDEYSL